MANLEREPDDICGMANWECEFDDKLETSNSERESDDKLGMVCSEHESNDKLGMENSERASDDKLGKANSEHEADDKLRTSNSDQALLTDNFLLVADGVGGALYQMRLDGTHLRKLQVSARMPSEIDFDPAEAQVYWSDHQSRLIKRVGLKHGSQEEIVVEFSEDSLPEGLAVDSKAKLLFYADAGRGIIFQQSLVTKHSRTLVTNTVKPRSLQIDPLFRYLYWSDWGKQTIERVNYNGTGRKSIVIMNDSRINGISLDLFERYIYWVDAGDDTIKKMPLEPVQTANANVTAKPQITTVFKFTSNLLPNKTSANFYGLALDEDYVYFTDWYDSAVLRVRRDGDGFQRLGNESLQTLNGIKVYKESVYRFGPETDCNIGNGDCSHFCIPVEDGLSCACPDDRGLKSDNKTCQEINGPSGVCIEGLAQMKTIKTTQVWRPNKTNHITMGCDEWDCVGADVKGPDLIWLEYDGFFTGYVRGIRGEPSWYLATREVRTWSIRSPAWYWTATDVDYHSNELYLVDKFDKFVVKMTLLGEKEISVIYYGTSSEVNGVAVDWVNKNIYWTDSLYNWILMARAEEKTNLTRRLIRTGLDKPHGIAVYPQKGLLFWTDWGMSPRIEMSTLAGENRRILLDRELTQPRGMTIDYAANRIFWANIQSVESINIDGTDRRRYSGFSGSYFMDIAIHNSYIFATDLGPTSSSSIMWFYNTSSTENGIKLGLQRKPFGVVMAHPDRQVVSQSPCGPMRCDQLCVGTPAGHGQCLCQDGYTLMGDSRSCKKDTEHTGPTYIYSMGDRICSVSAKDATTRLLKTPSNCFFNNPPKFEFHAMDFNFYSGEVYFSDVQFLVKTIRRADMTNKSENEVVVYGTGDVEGIGVDWVSSNVYWTDSTFKQVWIARLDGSLQTTLFDTEDKPLDLAIDPINKFMYWIEVAYNNTRAVIRRAGLDGSGQTDFVSENLQQPTGLAIDFRDQRLFWTDPGASRIESVKFDGTMRMQQKFFTKARYRPYDLAIFQDFIAFTDKQPYANISGLRVIERVSGKEVNDGLLHDGNPNRAFGVVAYDKHNQPLISENVAFSCNKDNGGCSQLCLSSPNGFRCACVNGMKLDLDTRTCLSVSSPKDDFFLLADDYRHQVYKVSGDLQTLSAIDFPRLDRPIGLTYDPQEDMLYWTDFDKGRIRRANMDGNNVQTVRNYRTGKPARIDALAFDHESRLLYYADMMKNEIAVLNPSGYFHKVIVKGNMIQPRALKLLPQYGHMYFGSKGKIERSDMDGNNRVTIVDSIGTLTKKGWVAGLDIDTQDGILYWCDHNAATIHASALDGSNVRTIVQLQKNADPFAVALRDGRLYWTDWKLRGVWSTSVTGQDVQSAHNETFTGLNDIIYFSSDLLSGPNVCSTDNGGCSHFCLPTPTGRTCACPDSGSDSIATFDGFNCPGLATCEGEVLNGRIGRDCHRRYNASCTWECNEGYGSLSRKPLRCGHDLMWDYDITLLCTDNTCPLLITPPNTMVDSLCPVSASFGAFCNHNCTDGYFRKSGDYQRQCDLTGQWTGTPLICAPKPTLPPVHASTHIGSNSMMPIIAGIVVAIVAAVLITLIVIFFLIKKGQRLPVPEAEDPKVTSRRKHKQHGGKYREDSNLTAEPQPTTTIPQASLVLNAQAPVYDVATGSIVFNRDIAFENPGYATQEEMATMGGNTTPTSSNNSQAPPLPEKKDNDTDSDDSDGFDDLDLKTPLPEMTGKAGFQNPLFANGKVLKEDNPYESLPDLKKK